MKSKYFKVVLCICLIGIAILTVCYKGMNSTVSSDKYIGSDHYVFFKEDIPKIDLLLDRTDLIVIGSASDEGKTERSSPAYEPEKMKEKYKKIYNKELTLPFTNINFNVEKVIYGKIGTADNSIVIQQNGEQGSDIGETKLVKGKKVLLLLEKKSDGKYKISGLENGAFDIDQNNNIISHGNDTAIKMFENKSINNLGAYISKYKKVEIESIN